MGVIWPPTSDEAAWKALADPEGEWMQERVAIKQASGVAGNHVEQAKRELRALWQWKRAVERAKEAVGCR